MNRNLCKKGIVLGIIFLFFGAGAVSSISKTIENSKNETTFRVNDDYNASNIPGYGELNFSTITEAVNKALAGYTIEVCNGTYSENVFIDKKLTLIGVREDEWGTDTNHSIISGPTVSVLIIGSESSGTEITNFIITNSSVAGILILGSKDDVIYRNIIKSNHIGILVFDSGGDDFNINYNNISENSRQGIHIKNSEDGMIDWNHIKNSKYGIELDSCTDIRIFRNHIENILKYDIWIESNEEENKIEENNFINSTKDLGWPERRWRNSLNVWDGNYWSDWKGFLPFYVVWGVKLSENSLFEIPWLWPQFDENPNPNKYIIPEIHLQ